MMQLYIAGQQYERQMQKMVNESATVEGGDGETTDTPVVPGRNVMLEQLIQLTTLALRGCDLGERVALCHQKRPCFKKIDSLCARMKQDLIRPDGVLANINSQGIAWAVKDLIFAFTRIINAWIIIRGYATCPSTAESLNKVRSGLSPNFVESFTKWQEVTMEFVEEIIKSFVRLDHVVQNQRGSTGKKSSPSRSNVSDDLSDTVEDSASLHTTVSDEDKTTENTEQPAEDPAYLKTGVYTPLQKPKEILKSPFGGKVTENAPDIEHFNDIVLKTTFGETMTRQVKYLVYRLYNLAQGEHFFSAKFIDNYFPEFSKILPNFIDIRTIILRTQVGEYTSIYEIVRDLRQIILDAQKYLAIRKDDELEAKTNLFKEELEAILKDDIFSSLNLS